MIVQDYELIEEIGSGSFSTVYKAQHVKTKEFFAIKKMREMPHNVLPSLFRIFKSSKIK